MKTEPLLVWVFYLFCFVGGFLFFFFLWGLTAVSYNSLLKFIHAHSQPMESNSSRSHDTFISGERGEQHKLIKINVRWWASKKNKIINDEEEKKIAHRQARKPETVVTQVFGRASAYTCEGLALGLVGWGKEGSTETVHRELWKWHSSQRHTWESGDMFMHLLTLARQGA